MRRLATALALLALAGLAVAQAPPDAEDVAGPDPVSIVGPPRGPELSGEALEKRTTEVAAKLRCPTCQGLSVQDSPTGNARNMRSQVGEMLARGFDEEQVLRYFETSYGEFVRLEPPMRGINWLVWLAPLGGLAAGGLIVAMAWRRLAARRAEGSDETPVAAVDRDRLPEDPALAAAVLRVREQVWGWPGGRSPEWRARQDRSEA